MTRKLSILTKARMWHDYIRYLIFLQQGESTRLLLGVFIFILSVYLLEHELVSKFKDTHGEQTISLIIVLVIIKFIWETYITQAELRSYFHIQRSILRNNLIKPFVKPGEKEKDLGFIPVEIPGNKSDLIFVSEKINDYLRTTPISIVISSLKQTHIKKYIQKHREILLQYLNHYFFTSLHANRQFTNDKKLCLSKDISLNSKHVTCHTGGYYDSFVTNQVSGTTLLIKDKVHTTITTEHIFPSTEDTEGNHYLSDIASSQMNDHLGCSTIGFTADNYIILWVQASTAQFNKDMLIPTGSGSSNYSDLTHHNLQQTVINTMERELIEESLPDKKIDNKLNKTLLLGFYRWVTRGGKPEFTGITKLPGNAEDYRPNPEEVRTDKHSTLKFKVDTLDQLPNVIADIKNRNNVSTPLFMCLYQLEQIYKTDKQALKDFLSI
jgi:hypothetical protein